MKITIPENWFVPKSKNKYDIKQKLDRFIELQSTKESSFLPNDKKLYNITVYEKNILEIIMCQYQPWQPN